MKVMMYKKPKLKEDRVEIHYRKINHEIKNLLEFMGYNHFNLEGYREDEKCLIDINDIFYFDTVDKKTFVYLKEDVYQIKYKLSEIEEKLELYGFVRISKSVVVNVYKVKYLKPEINMRINAYLENDEVIIINRHYNKLFKNKLNEIKTQLEEVEK